MKQKNTRQSFVCRDNNLWFDFTNKVKKEKKEVWEVLKDLIRGYLK